MPKKQHLSKVMVINLGERIILDTCHQKPSFLP